MVLGAALVLIGGAILYLAVKNTDPMTAFGTFARGGQGGTPGGEGRPPATPPLQPPHRTP